MQRRALGNSGIDVFPIGLGCMGMSDFYSPDGNDAASRESIRRAIGLGVDFFDTADMYGIGRNEELLGSAIADLRGSVIVATKFGVVRNPDGSRGICGRPEYIRTACDASLKRLGIEQIDLYYQHRQDPDVPVEESVGAMAELVRAGKVRALGLSEVAPATLRRACKVHPIAALQTEYSLWSREPEEELLATCRELGVAFVPYSPLGRGFLTGAIKSPEDLAPDDWRRMNPRFQGENFQKNLDLVDRIQAIAREKGCTPAQLALAWVLAQGSGIIPIPGTTKLERLQENLVALEVSLSADELARIDEACPPGAAAGTRYPAAFMGTVNR